MYQFPTWKYWLVIIVLVLGTLFALPNVFGWGDSLQLSRNDRQPLNAAGMERVKGILDTAKLPAEVAYLQNERLVLRFASEPEQVKARDTINTAAPGEYLIALAKAPRMPEFLRKLGLKPMSLGLDLRGGVNFVYEVDVDAAVSQALERLDRDTRVTLRDKNIPYVAVTTTNDVIRVALRSPDDVSKALKELTPPDASLQITTEQTEAGPVIEMRMTPAEIKRRQDIAVQQNITTLRNRVNELGVAEPIIQQQGSDRIVVQLPGVQDPNEAIRVLDATATVEFRLVDMNNDPYGAERTKRVPIGSKLYKMDQRQGGGPILLKREIIATGEQLSDATSGFSQGEPEVNVVLDARGGQEMFGHA